MELKASYFVEVDGSDITGALTNIVTSISVTDASGESADSASISLADKEGSVVMPPIGAAISIGLGFGSPTLIFEGFVDDVDSAGNRGGGTTLQISAKSADVLTGKLKEQSEKHQDDSTLGDTFTKWAKDAGLAEAHIHESLGSISRSYWSMDSESFMTWGRNIARQYGATFKVLGSRAILVPRSAGLSASGKSLQTVVAERPGNLKDWNIKPLLGRPQHKQFRTRHYDVQKGDWLERVKGASYQTKAEATMTTRYVETDADTSDAKAGSAEKESDRERGGGSVTIVGNTNAQAEAPCVVRGTRPGVDGTYRIDSATHTYSRGSGFETSLTLKQPGEGTGTDSR